MKRLLFFLFLIWLAGCGKAGLDFGPYSIGRDMSWFPLTLYQQLPNLNAFTNALVQEIAKVEDVPLHIYNIDWGQLFQILEEGEVAGIFTSLSPNVITKEKYTFSAPFLALGPVLIVPYESKATSLADLEGKIVSVNQFDETSLMVQQYPSIIIRLYQNRATALETLANGEVDAVLMSILDAQALVFQLYREKLKIVTGPLNNKALRLITLKDKHDSLIRHFNQGLETLLSSGKYDFLRHHYQLD
jgi:ABC-type amino acid transport substrate-binding protein